MAVLLSSSLLGEVRLGPEARVTPPGAAGPAPSFQYSPRAASNGRDFVAIWTDGREGSERGSLYASRLDAAGKPIEPFGTRIPGFAWARIASDGQQYLIADSLHTQRLDENGRPVGEPHALPEEAVPSAMASTGATYLVAARPYTGVTRVNAFLLDRNGAPLRTIELPGRDLLWLGAYDGRYVLIAGRQACDPGPCRHSIELHLIDDSGTVTERQLGKVVGVSVTAAASPDRILFTSAASPGAPDVEFQLVDYNGNFVNGGKATTLPMPHISELTAAWDGRQFLLLFRSMEVVAGAIVTAEGLPLHAAGAFTMSAAPSELPSFAASGSRQLLVWQDRTFTLLGDIVSRSVTHFNELVAPDTPNLVSQAGRAQWNVKLARAGQHELAVWTDDAQSRIDGLLNGTPIAIATGRAQFAAVAAGTRNFLVAWRDGTRLLGKRIGVDGTVDPEPLVLATDLPAEHTSVEHSIASDGSTYFVAAPAEVELNPAGRGRIRTVRVTEDGAIAGSELIEVTAGGRVLATRALWTGQAFVTAYLFNRFTVFDPNYPSFFQIGLVKGSDVQVVGEVFAYYWHITMAAAVGPDRITLLWTSTASAAETGFAQLTLDAKPLTTGVVAEMPNPYGGRQLELVWNGSEYVAAWSERYGTVQNVHAMRLDRNARIIDAPFVVAQDTAGFRPSIVVTPLGVKIAYSRSDAASGNSLRGFTRTLERLPGAPRRRGVRH